MLFLKKIPYNFPKSYCLKIISIIIFLKLSKFIQLFRLLHKLTARIHFQSYIKSAVGLTYERQDKNASKCNYTRKNISFILKFLVAKKWQHFHIKGLVKVCVCWYLERGRACEVFKFRNFLWLAIIRYFSTVIWVLYLSVGLQIDCFKLWFINNN